MTNYKQTGQMQLLDHHLATGTEATYTYTPGTALNMKTQYREIYIIITGKATAALNLLLKTNAGTDYNDTFINVDTTTVTGAVQDAETSSMILPSGTIDGASDFHATIKIFCNDAADLLCSIVQSGSSHEGLHFEFADNQVTATTITSIEIKTSTSTWIAGTEITTYGLLR